MSSERWRIAIPGGLLLVFLCAGDPLSGWSSASPTGLAATHQFIVREAYATLQQDPAYRADRFPSLEQILAYEGVSETVDTVTLTLPFHSPVLALIRPFTLLKRTGPGPDNMTPYSWHYYNPRRTEGMAASAAACYFSNLQRALAGRPASSQPDACTPLRQQTSADVVDGPPGKAAAYLAHFIADLSVSYHTNGMPASAALDANADTVPGGVLPDGAEGTAWRDAWSTWRSVTPRPDWFDPWYWDGSSELTGSHALYELAAAELSSAVYVNASNRLPGYTPAGLTRPAEGRVSGEDIAQFARWRSAQSQMEIRKPLTLEGMRQIGPVFRPPDTFSTAFYTPSQPPLLQQAIRDVRSAWRAAFSALQPTVDVVFDPDTGAAQVVVTVENADDRSSARNVWVTLEIVKGGKPGRPSMVRIPGEIKPRGTFVVRGVWPIGDPDPNIRLRAEVIGGFTDLPDSGEAIVEKTVAISPADVKPKPEPPPSPPLPGNATARPIQIAERHYPGGQLQSRTAYYPVLYPVTRTCKLTYPLRSLLDEGVPANYTDACRHGTETMWFQSGQKQSERQFFDGQVSGLRMEWCESGRKKGEIGYKADLRDGWTTSWDCTTGRVSARTEYRDGARTIEEEFWENGQLRSHCEYASKSDETPACTRYGPDGKIIRSTPEYYWRSAATNRPASMIFRSSNQTVGCVTRPSRWLATRTLPPIDLLSPNAMWIVPMTFSSSRITPVSLARSLVPMPDSATVRASRPCGSRSATSRRASLPPVISSA
jgi:hypothetical protein